MRRAIALLTALLASVAGAQTPTPIDANDVIVDAADSFDPAVGGNANGQFVVVWTESGVKAQRFTADGVANGGVLSVGTGSYPGIAVADSGAFLVVWRVN